MNLIERLFSRRGPQPLPHVVVPVRTIVAVHSENREAAARAKAVRESFQRLADSLSDAERAEAVKRAATTPLRSETPEERFARLEPVLFRGLAK